MTSAERAVARYAANTVTLSSGRRLEFHESGPQTGHPVFFLHGTPGSRIGPLPRPFDLLLRGIRLIAIDRPGYGGSDRHADRDVASIAADVAEVADALGVERFSVAGRSGGAPHALACGALLPERVSAVVALVSLAPHDAEDLDWYDGMTESNVTAYRLASAVFENRRDFRELERSLVNTRALAGDFIRDVLYDELPRPDIGVLSDARIRAELLEGFRYVAERSDRHDVKVDEDGTEGQYLGGQLDDHLAFVRPWGFDPADIRCPVLLWHGRQDVYSPASHSEWLARHIPDVLLDVNPNEAHFSAIKMFPYFLTWISQIAAALTAGWAEPTEPVAPARSRSGGRQFR